MAAEHRRLWLGSASSGLLPLPQEARRGLQVPVRVQDCGDEVEGALEALVDGDYSRAGLEVQKFPGKFREVDAPLRRVLRCVREDDVHVLVLVRNVVFFGE